MVQWEPVIGLEIHAQLATRSKMFCGCESGAAERPGTRVCPVCLGLPGALPVLNGAAVDLAVTAALALGCTIHPRSVFARKNYFYPDLPKGYQISQFDRPLATDGALTWRCASGPITVRIIRVHLEEDAGKSVHGVGEAGESFVDFNRSGVPLVEIVTHPDVRSAGEAAEFFERLREVLVEIGATHGNMEEGHLRCDANVSVRHAGQRALGTKVEVKNLNSFRFLQRALEYEIERQSAQLEAGTPVVHETRLWDVEEGRTVVMRSKEEAHDYRYFPEPDLPPLAVTPTRIAALRASLPELPEARRERLAAVHGLSAYDAALVGESRAATAYFERAVASGAPAKAVANWMAGELTRKNKEAGLGIDSSRVGPQALAQLIGLVTTGTISVSVAKTVFERMWESGLEASEVVRREGLGQIGDAAALEAIVREVVRSNPKPLAQYRAGKTLVFGFFVGQVMKVTEGKANPALVNQLVQQELDRA
jgi:aspartyl-tRNA(Asn)/glutamyl-tRNA(Gln) amidotransferase subunit B